MQTRGIGHQAQHGHGDVGEKSHARFGGHRRCIATPLPGGHGLNTRVVAGCDVTWLFEKSLGYESN